MLTRARCRSAGQRKEVHSRAPSQATSRSSVGSARRPRSRADGVAPWTTKSRRQSHRTRSALPRVSEQPSVLPLALGMASPVRCSLLAFWQFAVSVLPRPGQPGPVAGERRRQRCGGADQRRQLGTALAVVHAGASCSDCSWAWSLGSVLAMLSGLTELGERLIDPVVHMFRTMPVLALLPLFVIWFGIGEKAKVVHDRLGGHVPDLHQPVRGDQERRSEADRGRAGPRARAVSV